MVDHCTVWQSAGCLQDWMEAMPAQVAPNSRPASLAGQFVMPAKCLLWMETGDAGQATRQAQDPVLP